MRLRSVDQCPTADQLLNGLFLGRVRLLLFVGLK
jgi:hypothetical protein